MKKSRVKNAKAKEFIKSTEEVEKLNTNKAVLSIKGLIQIILDKESKHPQFRVFKN